MISIICPIYNEEKYIDDCILSIVDQDYPCNDMELLLIDGMSCDKTRDIINNYQHKYSFIRLLDNPNKIVPYALNIGINEAKGDVIIRLDAHAIFPNNYISELVKYLSELENAENVGGVCVTVPAKDSPMCRAIATVMSNKFGVGNSYFRIGASQITKVDTVPFGCFKRDLFNRIGLFDNDLTRNQDDEFNGRIIKNGGTIYLLPTLQIKYFARDKAAKMAKMFFQYGLFKPLVNKKLGAPATSRQFIPLLFLIGLVIGGVLSVFNNIILFLYVAVLVLYFGASIYCTKTEIIKEPNQLFILPWLFFIIHISYGWGYIKGIMKFLIGESNNINIKTNR